MKADFLECQGRKLFYLLLQPSRAEALGSILFLPPFTEEMHKSRHIVSAQARKMAADGYNVLLFDLSGCGDSGGEFGDATWQHWLEDANCAADFLASQGSAPLTLWGLRMGALLACELSRSREDVDRLLLWQPALNGEQMIDQFLRLRTVPVAAGSNNTFDRRKLWSELREGRGLEVAGYQLSSAMALGISRVRLIDLNPGKPVDWLEVTSRQGAGPGLASENVLQHWREQREQIEALTVPGEAFWRNAESGINPDLERQTLEALAR